MTNTVTRPYPKLGEVFELTLEPVSALSMVERDGHDDLHEWKYRGEEIREPQTKKFKLVVVGDQPNLWGVKKALKQYGLIPDGQWREAFIAAFPDCTGEGLVGFADGSWSAYGLTWFPVVGTLGIHVDGRRQSGFFMDDAEVGYGGEFWRWVVEVTEDTSH